MPPRRVIEDLNGPDPETEDRDDDTVLEAGDADDDVSDELEDEGPEDEETDEGDEEGSDETPIGDEETDEPVRQTRRETTRGQRQFGEVRRRAREAERRAHELELENTRLRQQNNRTNEPEPEVARRARLAAMEPEERAEYLINEVRQETRNQRAIDNFRAQDRSDLERFQAEARRNPTYRQHAAAVERRLEILRAQGQNVPRETILKFIVGERVLQSRKSPKTNKQRDEAARRVQDERVSLPRNRGETRGGSRGGSKSADLEKRLANVPI